MEKIIIRPNGIFYAYFDDQTETWIEKDIFEGTLPLSWYLPMQVEIRGQVSILKILELFERFDEQLEFTYVRALKTLGLDDIMNVLDQVQAKEPSSLKATCLVWVGETYPSLGEDPMIRINSALVGLDTDDLDSDEEVGDDEVYQLTNFDFVEWVKLPLYLDEYLDFVERGQEEVLFAGEYLWTLHNMFETIFEEISLNLFVSGLVSNPDIVIDEHHAKFTATDFFNYLDDLGDISDRLE